MAHRIALIGFGEAAQAFTEGADWSGSARAYDELTDDPLGRPAKLEDYSRLGIEGANCVGDALESAELIVSLVTAGQALAAAKAAAPHIRPGAIYCEMNSVAPETKRLGASVIELAGGRFVDVAIMAPVNPRRRDVPLLLSGPIAADGEKALKERGFTNLRCVGNGIGDAASIKMIRSVIVKGIEALTAEAMLAASAAGVVDEVLASLDSSDRVMPWAERANYNFERMMTHGVRRADEMTEAAQTLNALGVTPYLTRCAALRQHEMGSLGIRPAAGLRGKLAQLRPTKANAA